MFEAIAGLLAWFYDLVPSYGIAILLLTMAVMVVLTPLTISGTRSMMKMQRMNPEMKRLQAKYSDDKERLNQEMMAFYKENNINPVLGCLPMFLQIPVFLVLFNVLRGLTDRAGGVGSALGHSAREAATNSTPSEWEATFAPKHIDESSAMFQDLSGATEMKSFGIDLALSAQEAIGRGILVALPLFLMIALVALTSWYQQRQIQARQSKSGSNAPVNDQQQMIMKMMPWLLPIFSFTMPAGLVLYFIASNVYRVGQQGFINRTMDDEASGEKKKSSGKPESNGRSSNGSGPNSSARQKSARSGKNSSGRSSASKSKQSTPTSDANPSIVPRQRKAKRKNKKRN